MTMTQTILLGLAGMMSILLFSCMVSFYQDIKTNLKYRMGKLQERKWDRETRKLKTKMAESPVQFIPVKFNKDIQRGGMYEIAPGLYEELEAIQEEFDYTRHAHTPVI